MNDEQWHGSTGEKKRKRCYTCPFSFAPSHDLMWLTDGMTAASICPRDTCLFSPLSFDENHFYRQRERGEEDRNYESQPVPSTHFRFSFDQIDFKMPSDFFKLTLIIWLTFNSVKFYVVSWVAFYSKVSFIQFKRKSQIVEQVKGCRLLWNKLSFIQFLWLGLNWINGQINGWWIRCNRWATTGKKSLNFF